MNKIIQQKKMIAIYDHALKDSSIVEMSAYYILHVFTENEIFSCEELKNFGPDFYPYKKKNWSSLGDFLGPFLDFDELSNYLKKLGKAVSSESIHLLSVTDYNNYLLKSSPQEGLIQDLANMGRKIAPKEKGTSVKKNFFDIF